MKDVRVLLVGAKGRMGQAIAAAAEAAGVVITAGLDQGDDLTKEIGGCDVVVDFSHISATDAICRDGDPYFKLAVDPRTGVLATADGIVELAAPSGDYGNLVVINHGFGLATRYGHMSKFAVWQGQQVKRGDVIGYVGATGRATGPHLHYEVLANGKLMNPLQLLAGKSAQD